MALLRLTLSRVSVLGIYGRTGDAFPNSAALLHPEAARAFEALERGFTRIRCSDVFRTPEQSLEARASKAGVQPPGFSAHNFGLAIDVDVARVMREERLTKPQLDARLAEHGWWCHRRDGLAGAFESWHYNFLGPEPIAKPFLALCQRNTAPAIEAKIRDVYGDQLELEPVEAQLALAKLGLYRGSADGVFGPRSKAALVAFQRAWELAPLGELDARTQRTLALISADLEILERTN